MTTPEANDDEEFVEGVDFDWISEPLFERPIPESGHLIHLRQERIRGILALSLTGIFGLVLILPFILILIPGSWDNAKEWLQTALPAVTGLLGAVMGFYFGQRSNN